MHTKVQRYILHWVGRCLWHGHGHYLSRNINITDFVTLGHNIYIFFGYQLNELLFSIQLLEVFILGWDEIWRCCLTRIGTPIIKIRWSLDCLIFIMGMPIPGKMILYWKKALYLWSFLCLTVDPMSRGIVWHRTPQILGLVNICGLVNTL